MQSNSARGIHPMAHHCFFHPFVKTSALDPDGYFSVGTPPAPFTRRMWAGAEITYHARSPFLGEHVACIATFKDPQYKHGKSGPLLFLTKETDYFSMNERVKLMTERVQYVFTNSQLPLTPPPAPAPSTPVAPYKWILDDIELNEALLFR